ncbi:hypothetical protein ACLOJK_009009 [Asimina triloba]
MTTGRPSKWWKLLSRMVREEKMTTARCHEERRRKWSWKGNRAMRETAKGPTSAGDSEGTEHRRTQRRKPGSTEKNENQKRERKVGIGIGTTTNAGEGNGDEKETEQ